MNHSFLLVSLLIMITLYSCNSLNAQQETSNCIQDKVEAFKKLSVANPPIGIYQYYYNGDLVHYVSSPCCDQYTTLYDENCNIICHPSGGITGNGDSKCPDFFEKRTNEKVIWQDDRKP